MTRHVFVFDRPERFVAGTVGQPGERTFFLQAADRGRVVSVALEKAQVVMLADRLEQLLDDIASRTGQSFESAEIDQGALLTPIDEEFRVSAMGLAWNGDDGLIVIEAQAPTDDIETAERTLLEDTEEGPDALRVALSAAKARAFVARARQLVSAGRPPCPLCGQPLSPDGHVCPRNNGYHRDVPFTV